MPRTTKRTLPETNDFAYATRKHSISTKTRYLLYSLMENLAQASHDILLVITYDFFAPTVDGDSAGRVAKTLSPGNEGAPVVTTVLARKGDSHRRLLCFCDMLCSYSTTFLGPIHANTYNQRSRARRAR